MIIVLYSATYVYILWPLQFIRIMQQNLNNTVE